MNVNIDALKQLIKEKFNGNMAEFSREIQIDYSYINQILNNHKPSTSKKLCDNIIRFCKKNNLKYTKYIFF